LGQRQRRVDDLRDACEAKSCIRRLAGCSFFNARANSADRAPHCHAYGVLRAV
jgi:hypothetical protein